jgi:hypothetical protein
MTLMHRARAALALVGFALVAATTAGAQELPGRVGRIADIDGTVWLRDGDDREWTAARRNRPLTGRDHLATDNDARAELHVGSSTLRLGPATEVEFVELDDERIEVAVHRGSVALRVRSDAVADELIVVTDDGRLRPLRAGHYRIDVEPASSFALAWSGEVRFEGSDSSLVVGAGQRAEFWRERDGRTHYSWSSETGDDFGAWALGRDRDEMRYAGSRYVSPEMTGAVELDRYGRWDRHPQYGGIWYPNAVAADWAPYRHGSWAWVAPWGWTWVDDAPWGFAPFHYGRWVSWQGRWGWVPGTYVARPVYAPALVAWLGGGNVSVGISIGGPSVGWVPLAPHEVFRPYYAYSPRYWQRINPGVRYEPRPVRTGPIMYTNQGVPGGVTVVSSNVLRERRPVARAVLSPQTVDLRSLRPAAAPPASMAPRVVAEPGGARRAGPPPGWSRGPAARVQQQRDDNDARRGPAAARLQPRDDDEPRRAPPGARAVPPRDDDGDRRGPVARPQPRDDDDVRRGPAARTWPRADDDGERRGRALREQPLPPQRIERERAEPRGGERVRPVMPAVPAAPPPVARPQVPVAQPTVPMAQPTVPVARPGPPPQVRDLREMQRREPPGQAQREIRREQRDDGPQRGGPPGRERQRER